MEVELTTLIEFYRALPENWFILDHDEDGYFAYEVSEGLAGLNWDDPSLHRPVIVLWNEAYTVALVSDLNRADPRCMVLKAKSEVFGQ